MSLGKTHFATHRGHMNLVKTARGYIVSFPWNELRIDLHCTHCGLLATSSLRLTRHMIKHNHMWSVQLCVPPLFLKVFINKLEALSNWKMKSLSRHTSELTEDDFSSDDFMIFEISIAKILFYLLSYTYLSWAYYFRGKLCLLPYWWLILALH